MKLILPCTIAVLLASVLPAFPWGRDGHEIIAELAQTMLTSNAQAKAQSLLGTNDLASVAVWADQARQLMTDYHNPGPLQGNTEAEQFIKDHKDNDNWHFMNLPLNTFTYVYNGQFAATNDIVHALTNCIAVLEGKSTFMNKTQALRYIVHLVGDLHQPLHVACGFYVTNGTGGATLQTDPASITNIKAHDRGANLLVWMKPTASGKISTNNLHAFWDDDLVSKVDTNRGNKQMLTILQNTIDKRKWKSTGDCHNWPARWAKDSAKEARGVYEGIAFGAATFNHKGAPKEIVITLPSDYESEQTPRATRQLSKAAFHLAELLNKIQWK